jgi:hypothetical protein
MITILADNKTDKGYLQDELTTSDPLRIYIEQIKMALESTSGNIMGADNYFDLEDLVFEQNLDENQIRTSVRSTISGFCSLYDEFDTEINVRFAQGELRDHCMIDIKVNKENALKIIIN